MKCFLVSLIILAATLVQAAPSKKQTVIEDYRQRASEELVPSEEALKEAAAAENVRSTPGTVVTSTQDLQNPVIYDGLMLGVTLQQYRPQGLGRVVGLPSYDYSSLDPSPMVGLQLRWLPWQFNNSWGKPQLGFLVSARYAKHMLVERYEASGPLGETQLHSLLSDVGTVIQWNIPKHEEYSFAAELSVGRLDAIQTSENRLANSTNAMLMSSFTVSAKRRVGNYWLNLAYDQRYTSFGERDGIRKPANQFVLGFLYALR